MEPKRKSSAHLTKELHPSVKLRKNVKPQEFAELEQPQSSTTEQQAPSATSVKQQQEVEKVGPHEDPDEIEASCDLGLSSDLGPSEGFPTQPKVATTSNRPETASGGENLEAEAETWIQRARKCCGNQFNAFCMNCCFPFYCKRPTNYERLFNHYRFARELSRVALALGGFYFGMFIALSIVYFWPDNKKDRASHLPLLVFLFVNLSFSVLCFCYYFVMRLRLNKPQRLIEDISPKNPGDPEVELGFASASARYNAGRPQRRSILSTREDPLLAVVDWSRRSPDHQPKELKTVEDDEEVNLIPSSS